MFFARGYKSAQTKHGSKFSSFFFVPQLRINPRRFTLFSIFKTQPSSPFHVLLCLIVWVSVRQYFHLSGHTRDLVSSKALTVDTNDLPIFSSPYPMYAFNWNLYSFFTVPPVISSLHPGSNLTVRKGSTVKLACNATGFPKPDITWQREVRDYVNWMVKNNRWCEDKKMP